jgi:Tol biopolymer transport system component
MRTKRILLASVVALWTVTTWGAPQRDEPARVSSKPAYTYKLAFASDRTGDFEVYLVNLDGSGLTRLTRMPGTNEFPVCAPDGKTIAVHSEGADGRAEIYLFNADGTGKRNWTDHPADDLYPRFSPDATRIAFMSNREGNYDIYIGHVSGPGLIRVTTDAADDVFPSWRPEVVAFVSTRDGDSEIYLGPDDGSYRPVRLTDHRGVDEFPFFSPDGRWLIYHSHIAGNTEICLMQPDGSGWRNLTLSTANDASPSWSGDGKWIAFGSDRQGDWSIYKIRPDGSDLTRLTDDRRDEMSPSWFPDGTGIVFRRREGPGANADLWTMKPDGTAQRRITDNPAADGFISWLIQPAPTD